MPAEKIKTIRVAAVQMVSENGRIDKNLAHALTFVEEAAQKGAKLIALPEFMAACRGDWQDILQIQLGPKTASEGNLVEERKRVTTDPVMNDRLPRR
jgi:predicted amidohydrolase